MDDPPEAHRCVQAGKMPALAWNIREVLDSWFTIPREIKPLVPQAQVPS